MLHAGGEPPSVRSRRRGLAIIKRYAIVACPHRDSKSARLCPEYVIVRRGQRAARCRRGHVFWLDKIRPLAVSDFYARLRALIPRFRGNVGAGLPLFYRSRRKPLSNHAHRSTGKGQSRLSNRGERPREPAPPVGGGSGEGLSASRPKSGCGPT